MTTFAFEYFSRSETGLVRKANEDSCGDAQTPYGHVFVVCDGMGGHVGGAVASKMAVECILEYLSGQRGESTQAAISGAIAFANTQIFARAHHDVSLKGMGTTCTVAVVAGDGRIYYGHVGDSRIYLFSGGRLHRITRDHSYVQLLVDTGQIREEDAESHPNKNQILRALGIDENVKTDVAGDPVLPAAGDMLLLCSDGLSGMTTDAAMESVLQNGGGEVAVSRLIQLALDGGGKDNVTATLVQITQSPNASTVFRKPVAPAMPAEPMMAADPTPDPTLTLAGSDNRGNRKFVIIGAVATLLLAAAAFFFWPGLGKKSEAEKPAADKPAAAPAPKKTKDGKSKSDTASAGKLPPKPTPEKPPVKSGTARPDTQKPDTTKR